MTAPATQETSRQPFLRGSIIWQRRFGLPVWGWLLILLALVIVIMSWRRRAKSGSGTEMEVIPGQDTQPNPIFIVPQAATPAVNVVMPTPPTAPPAGGSPSPTTPLPTSPGSYVVVKTYTKTNTPWEATLSGIWAHTRTTAGWEQIWNHPMNNELRALRKKPELIRAGDRVFVPGWNG